MHNFRELKVWQKAIDFSVEVYKLTADLPKEEKYGLISQIRRAVVSISSNIAEGSGRKSNKEFVYFLALATGSAYETETQLIISNRLQYISNEAFGEAITKLTEI